MFAQTVIQECSKYREQSRLRQKLPYFTNSNVIVNEGINEARGKQNCGYSGNKPSCTISNFTAR